MGFSPKEPAVPARITLDPLKMGSSPPGDGSWDRRRPRKCADDCYAECESKRRRVGETQPGTFSWMLYRRQLEELRTLRLNAFYYLLEHSFIWEFLRVDSCFKMSDKYLLAMTLKYFERAGLELIEYTLMNFFAALFLANEMQEDVLFRANMYPLVLPEMTPYHIANFGRVKNWLWTRMGYQALVSKEECKQVYNGRESVPLGLEMREEGTSWLGNQRARTQHRTILRSLPRLCPTRLYSVPAEIYQAGPAYPVDYRQR
ncbi:speedy protein C-like [Rhinophrynus dorsalis]